MKTRNQRLACCNDLIYFFYSRLAKLVGIAIGVAIFVVVVCVLCCCCCPFCLLAKKRSTRGEVIRTSGEHKTLQNFNHNLITVTGQLIIGGVITAHSSPAVSSPGALITRLIHHTAVSSLGHWQYQFKIFFTRCLISHTESLMISWALMRSATLRFTEYLSLREEQDIH